MNFRFTVKWSSFLFITFLPKWTLSVRVWTSTGHGPSHTPKELSFKWFDGCETSVENCGEIHNGVNGTLRCKQTLIYGSRLRNWSPPLLLLLLEVVAMSGMLNATTKWTLKERFYLNCCDWKEEGRIIINRTHCSSLCFVYTLTSNSRSAVRVYLEFGCVRGIG